MLLYSLIFIVFLGIAQSAWNFNSIPRCMSNYCQNEMNSASIKDWTQLTTHISTIEKYCQECTKICDDGIARECALNR